MKRNFVIVAACLMLLASCSKEEQNPITPPAPTPPSTEEDNGSGNGNGEENEDKTEYEALMSYIDRSKHPDFLFGVAMSANEFMSNQSMRKIALDNFDNMTPGNEMKYSSVVRDNGSMDFSTVRALIENARQAGTEIYGHTLAWHSQQNVTYLNSLLEDIKIEDSEVQEEAKQLVSNPACGPEDMTCYLMNPGDGKFVAPEVVEPGADGTGYALMVPAKERVDEDWDNQFFLSVSHTFKAGEPYVLSMKIKADKEATVDLQAHTKAGSYIHYNIAGGTMSFTTEWTEFKYEGTIPAEADGMRCIAWNLSKFAEANNYYFDDIQWTVTTRYEGSRPQTEEEKRTALIGAMETWIKGMMEACGGYVTAWDVVNEAIAGSGDDGSGNYPLQHGSNSTNFFWQDYMGDELYVRKAVELARKYFAEYGGNPSDLKLFVNDYNLEGDWDGNKKCISLVNWIKKWESDNVTKIDGIGTQMHVSCSMNAQVQASREAAVENMFRILAASGKLIKITELDVGVTDASGNTVLTKNATKAHNEAIADYYDFIISKYFEIVPKEQQFGITIWSPVDSPADSYWRAGEPIGLWDQHYARKPAYDGVAEALMENLSSNPN